MALLDSTQGLKSNSASSVMSVTSINDLTLGDRVAVKSSATFIPLKRSKTKIGTLRFLGDTQFAVGQWAGIELDEPIGQNDGSVDGMRYFQCRPKHGLFSPLAKVSRVASGADWPLVRPERPAHLSDSQEILTFQNRIESLENALQSKDAEIRRLQEELENGGKESADQKAQLPDLRAQLEDVESKCAALERQCRDGDQQRTEMESELSKARRENADLRQTIDDLQLVIRNLEEEESQLDARINQLELENQNLRSESTSKDQLVAAMNQEQHQCQLELEELKQQEDSLLISIQQLEAEVSKSKEESQSLNSALTALESHRQQWLEEKTQMLETIDDLNQQVTESTKRRQDYDQLSTQLKRLSDALEEERAAKVRLQTALDESEQRCHQTAEHSNRLILDNWNQIQSHLQRFNDDQARVLQEETRKASQAASNLRDELQQLTDKLAETKTDGAAQDPTSNPRLVQLEQMVANHEQDMATLRQQVADLRRRLQCRSREPYWHRHPAAGGPFWRDFWILNALLRQSRLRKKHV